MMQDIYNIVGGKRAAPNGRGRIELIDPNSGSRTGSFCESSEHQIRDAVSAAMDYQDEPADWDWPSRREILHEWAASIQRDSESLALIDAAATGVPLSTTRLLVDGAISRIRDVTEECEHALLPVDRSQGNRKVRLHRRPYGPALLLIPWNAPTFVLATKLAWAYAVGAPAIVKPSELAPQSAVRMVENLLSAGAAPQSVQLVHGSGITGAALVKAERVASVLCTGGSATGRAIATEAGRQLKRVHLELGGANPVLIAEDAPVEQAAAECVRGMLALGGQWCEAPRRVFVPNHMLADFVDLALTYAAKTTIGTSTDEDSTMGPLVSELQRERIESTIGRARQAGGDVRLSHDELPCGGFFTSPVVIHGHPAELSREEVFGPLLQVHGYSQLSQATAEAREGASGLAGYVFAEDVELGMHLAMGLRAGEVKINGARVSDMAAGSRQDFFGSSGIGGHGGTRLLDALSGYQIVGVDDLNSPL